MRWFIVYDDTGRILRCGLAPEELVPLQARAGERWAVLDAQPNDAEQYVEDIDLGTLAARPELPTFDTLSVPADGLSAAKASGLPAGTKAFVSSMSIGLQEAVIDDGELALTFELPGVYSVRLFPPHPWKPAEVTINAT